MMWDYSSTSWNLAKAPGSIQRGSDGRADEQRDAGARARPPARLHGRRRRRAALLRRAPGDDRSREVHDLPDAGRAGARRAARARRQRRVRRRQPVLAVRRPARPVGGAGPPGPPRDGAGRQRHPGVGPPLGPARRPGRPGRPGRLAVPARHARLVPGRRTDPHLGARQGLRGVGRPRPAGRLPRPVHAEDHHHPCRSAARRRRRPCPRLRLHHRRARGRPDRCRRPRARAARRARRRARHLRSHQPALPPRRRARPEPDHPGGRSRLGAPTTQQATVRKGVA